MSGERDSPAPLLDDSLPESPMDGLSGWDLPGRGERPEDCGKDVTAYCECCGHHWTTQKTCDKKTCPSCFRRWAYLGGKRTGLGVWAKKKIIMGRKRGGRLLHIVISFPYEGGEENDYRKRAYKVCKEHGIEGGVSILHHCRDRNDLGRVPDGYIHYHVIGLAKGHVVPGTCSRELFHVIRDRFMDDYKGFRRAREVVRCIRYLLTHASVKERRHTISWFGSMSYNKLPNSRLEAECPEFYSYITEKRKRICPECGSRETSSLGWDVDIECDNWHKSRFPSVCLASALENFNEAY